MRNNGGLLVAPEEDEQRQQAEEQVWLVAAPELEHEASKGLVESQLLAWHAAAGPEKGFSLKLFIQ